MKLFLSLSFALLTANAQTGLPPLIDRELLFGNPEIAGAQLSPDGKYMSFLKPWKGTLNVWVKGIAQPFTAARLLTAETKRPIMSYFWTRDSKFIIFSKDNDGDENFNIYRVNPAPTPTAAAAPPAKDLTGIKGARVLIYNLPKSDPDVAYIGINDRDKAYHDLYKLKLSTGEKTLVRKNTEQASAWVFDLQGNLRLATRTAPNGDQETLRVDAASLTPIYSCSMLETCAPARFHKDGKQVYFETNKGDRNLTELTLLDITTGATTKVESDPLNRVDFGNASFNEADELIATAYDDDKLRRYFHSKAFEADYDWLETKLPGLQLSTVSRTRDENLWLVAASGDVEPGATYLYNRRAKTLTQQYKVRERVPRSALAERQVIRYQSSDGLEIPAYLTIPKGIGGKGLPLVVVPHGGPWARDSWGYDPIAQFLANRGYAVLQPNFRGSTGFGKKFLNAGNGEWGKKMQDDLTWGVKHLVSQGVADPKRVGILGGSYGGYATLAGVAFTPDVYRAGVDIVGPSNLNTLLDSVPPYWEAMRKMLYGRMADPSTADGKKWLADRSPLNFADKIKTPLMVIQGANDPRVNQAEADQIVIALRDRKFPVEYLLAKDEGHGFARPVNNMAMFMAVERFLARHLDGRYQEGGTPEAVARLKEITVDPATVTYKKPIDTKNLTMAAPAFPLTPGTWKYDAKVEGGPQPVPLKLSTVIVAKDGNFIATETMETPMGPAVDTTTLDGKTLAPIQRNVKQGPLTIDIQFADGKATGKMVMGGQERPLNTNLGGSLFADGAGSYAVLGTLPLKDGYQVHYRNVDLQRGKSKLMLLSVNGEEEVSVAAGKFKTWIVDLSSADGGKDMIRLWIDQAARQVVKVSAAMPNQPGANLNAELLPK